MTCLFLDNRSVVESIGSQSEGVSTVASNRFRMDVVCVIDLHQPEHLQHRKRALEEIKQACTLVNANLHHVQVCTESRSYKNAYRYNE